MEGVPAGIGSWSVMRVFLLYIFPASLIDVLYALFFYAHQSDSPDSESKSFPRYYFKLVTGLHLFFLHCCVTVLFHDLTNAAYIADGNPVPRTTTTEHPLYGPFRETSKGKKLKACAVMVGSLMLYSLVSTAGIHFTSESVAEWGLPPATIFKYVTLVSTAATTYLILVKLVLFIWLRSPPTLPPL